MTATVGQTPILTAQRLGRRLDNGWIWRGVDLSLAAGERAVLTGRSGTGKSLLLRTLCGLDRPDEGVVHHRGKRLRDHDVPRFRARVAYVPQQPVLIPGTVLDNLELPLRFHVNAGGGTWKAKATALLSQVGKPVAFLDQRASLLSGGEGQVVGLVRALLLGPEILLLDEPTAHLDAEATQRVEDVILDWVDSGDRAVLWTTHDSAQIDRVRRGAAIELGSAP